MSDVSLIKECFRENRVSKNGNAYQVLVIVFSSGYKFESFLSNEQQFILNSVPLK